MGFTDKIQEVLWGAATGAVSGALDAAGRTRAPRTDLSPTNNYFFMGAQDEVAPEQILVPAAFTMDDVIPSTLHVSYAASEEDEDWFEVTQPAVVSVFAFGSDDELTAGMRLGQQIDVDVAPDLYGALVVLSLKLTGRGTGASRSGRSGTR